MTPVRELDISSELQSCFTRTETACVSGCCGLGAFEPDAKVIRAWALDVGPAPAIKVLEEIRVLVAAVSDRSSIASSEFLNVCTPDDASRDKLIAFFREYERALITCV
jgi:hypothetical protein